MDFSQFYEIVTRLHADPRTHNLTVVMEADAGLAEVGGVEIDGVSNQSTPQEITVRINAA